MRCAWTELLAILPQWMRQEVDQWKNAQLQEIRLRMGYPPEMVLQNGNTRLTRKIQMDDLCFVINTASQYSPWAASTAAQGYITAPGGHRIGICGEVVWDGARMTGMRTPSSVCIRIARDLEGIAVKLRQLVGSVLIIGKPGSGKTTLLRDFIRIRSNENMYSIGVVDERGELFPEAGGFVTGPRTDVLRGCSKKEGIEILLRTMGPGAIAVDEITSEQDCIELLRAGWCGVDLLATAHAASKSDLYTRPIYRALVKNDLFDHLVILRSDKSCITERMGL